MSALKQNISDASSILYDHVEFSRLTNHVLNATNYIESRFDKIIADTLEKTYTGEIQNLIISCPPGVGKTARTIITYAARGFAINPGSRFVHLTFSNKLVLANSQAIKTVIESPEYQKYFPYVKTKKGSESKEIWETDAGGRFVASPSNGQVTGFRAGLSGYEGFAGAVLMDDMTKTEALHSQVMTDAINRRWATTFRSRKAVGTKAPFILCMQRLGENDFTGHLLNNSGIKWHHLVLPSYIHEDYVYTGNGNYIDHGLSEGSLWPEVWTDDEALQLMSDVQYSQNPQEAAGDVFQKEWFQLYTELPPVKSWHIYADTASKTNKYNDFTCFQLWALSYDKKIYMVDQFHDRVRVPQLISEFGAFRDRAFRHARMQYTAETGSQAKPNQIKIFLNIEDKDSGIGLIQGLQDQAISVRAISRKIGKYARFTKAAPKIKHGNVFLPRGQSMTQATIAQAVQYKEDDSHAFDDRLDPMIDMINDHLVTSQGAAVHMQSVFS